MRKPSGIIALLTDFGLKDPYVAIMKAVILKINPVAVIIDISHEVPSFDIDRGALVLWASYKYFPPGTVFVCVVDPGVGSARKSIAIASKNYYFVGPDNGLMYLAAEEDGFEEIVYLENEEYFLHPVSHTFHGRDIFSPVAAWISKGVKLSELGPRVSAGKLVKPSISILKSIEGETIKLKAIYIDKFGNVALSARFSTVFRALGLSYSKPVTVETKSFRGKATVAKTFAEVNEGELAFYENSFGLAELGVFKGSAAEELGVKKGEEIVLSIT